MELQLKNWELLLTGILEYCNGDFVVLDMVLMDNHYNLIHDFDDTVVNPNVIHKMKFHPRQ